MSWFNFFSKPNDVVYVIGDSHTRCFSFNKNFIPMFVGEGRKYNFISEENYNNVRNKTLKIIRTISRSAVIIFFGEPDTRFLLGKGWTPWNEDSGPDESMRIDFEKTNVEECIKNYKRFLEECLKFKTIQLFVLGICPSVRTEQNHIVKKYNKALKALCDNLAIEFIDIEKNILIDGQFNMEYYGDPVHVNNKIQVDLEQFFIKKNILEKSYFNSAFEWDNKKVQGEYVFNEQFGCFVQKKY